MLEVLTVPVNLISARSNIFHVFVKFNRAHRFCKKIGELLCSRDIEELDNSIPGLLSDVSVANIHMLRTCCRSVGSGDRNSGSVVDE